MIEHGSHTCRLEVSVPCPLLSTGTLLPVLYCLLELSSLSSAVYRNSLPCPLLSTGTLLAVPCVYWNFPPWCCLLTLNETCLHGSSGGCSKVGFWGGDEGTEPMKRKKTEKGPWNMFPGAKRLIYCIQF